MKKENTHTHSEETSHIFSKNVSHIFWKWNFLVPSLKTLKNVFLIFEEGTYKT